MSECLSHLTHTPVPSSHTHSIVSRLGPRLTRMGGSEQGLRPNARSTCYYLSESRQGEYRSNVVSSRKVGDSDVKRKTEGRSVEWGMSPYQKITSKLYRSESSPAAPRGASAVTTATGSVPTQHNTLLSPRHPKHEPLKLKQVSVAYTPIYTHLTAAVLRTAHA